MGLRNTGIWDVLLFVFTLALVVMSLAWFVGPLMSDSAMGYSSSYLDKAVSVPDTSADMRYVYNPGTFDIYGGLDFAGVTSVFDLDYTLLTRVQSGGNAAERKELMEQLVSPFHRLYSGPELVLLFAVQDSQIATTPVVNTLFLQSRRLQTNGVSTGLTSGQSTLALLNTNLLGAGSGGIAAAGSDPWVKGTLSYGHGTVDWELGLSASSNYSRIDLDETFEGNRFEFAKSVLNVSREDPISAERKYYLSYQPMFSAQARSEIQRFFASGSWAWLSDFDPDQRGYWFFVDASNYTGINYFNMIDMLQGYRLRGAD